MFLDNDFLLMNKDVPVLEFTTYRDALNEVYFQEEKRFDAALPIGYESIGQWIEDRQAPKHREHIEKLLKMCGCYDLDAYIRVTMALTLNDTFWVKPADKDVKWNEVSLYCNKFNEVIARLAFEGGLYGQNFSSTSPEFGTDGAYAKCWVREGNEIYLYKAGTSGFSNAGLEPFSEVYSSQIAEKICNRSVTYHIDRYHGKVISKCQLFTSEKYGFVPISKILPKRFRVQDLLNLYAAYESEDDFRRMVVLDALVLNTDRHAGNHGLLVDNDTLKPIMMAPIFDNNQGLLPYAVDENFENLEQYLQTKGPRIGSDFNEIAYQMLTPEIKADLINLKGFQFTRGKIDLPEERIKALEQLVNRQIDKILNNIRIYVPENLSMNDDTIPSAGTMDAGRRR